MKYHRRWAALLVAALLIMNMAMAWAEPLAGSGSSIEGQVAEYGVLDLSGAQEVVLTDDAAREDSPALEAAQAWTGSDYEIMEIDETLYVSDEMWSGVNVTRARGFKGKLAIVEGTLALDDVLIEGASATNLSLEGWFDLTPGASVICAPGDFLNLDRSLTAINKDEKVTLNPSVGNESIQAKKVKWSSSNKKIATVDSKGVVKGKKKGTAVITAQYNGDVATCSVVVNELIMPKKIKLDHSSLTLGFGETSQLEYSISPADAEIVDLTWTSSKPNIASVDDEGFITALSGGETKITVATSNGKKATCKVKVKEIKPTKVKFTTSSVTLEAGEIYAATVNVTPSNASNPEVRYTSSKVSVAGVDEDGIIYALGAGTATITAVSAANAKVKGTMKVTVKAPTRQDILPTAVQFTSTRLTLTVGEAHPTTVTVSPSNATNREVYYTSNNADVAIVDGNGVIYPIGAGTAVITATSVANPQIRGTLTVSVNGTAPTPDPEPVPTSEPTSTPEPVPTPEPTPTPDNSVKPKTIKFKKQTLAMKAGETCQIALTMTPQNVTNREVYLSSSNENVAIVDSDTGVITALDRGTATITAVSAADPRIQATCKVTVTGKAPDPNYVPGSGDLTGLIIGINPGHQHKTIKDRYPIAPGSSKTAYGVKTGASGRSTHQNEYDVVLDIGLKLMRILEDHGATVVITRTHSEVMLTNIDRAQMLNEAGVDVALQLHNNSSSNTSKSGVSGYIRTTGDWVEESRGLAECLCKGMADNTPFPNLGVKIENEFMSLNWTTTPSVLLEMGYLSNRSDDKLLALDETREALAWGIYEGLCAYYGR